MTTRNYLEDLKMKGVVLWVEGSTLRYRAPKEIVVEMREELAGRKAEIIALLEQQARLACHYCSSKIRVAERENFFEFECEADPLHYFELKRKPGADRLWADVPLPNEMDDQQILFS